MSIDSELKKQGVKVISALDTLKVNSIAKNIAQKLVSAFPEHDFKLGELFIRLSRLHMYTAEMPAGISEANYCYKNSSVYFNEKIDINNIDSCVIHECIHSLQERNDERGRLERLGLSTFSAFQVYHLGLNEAAVQLAASKAQGCRKDTVKYYGISFDTISPSCYPLECNLLSQMAYITGEYALFDSTFNANDTFKNKFIELVSEEVFENISKNFDKLLKAEADIAKLNNSLEAENSAERAYKINQKITKQKELINTIFITTQNLIMTSYFNTSLLNINNLEELENYRRKLYNYKNIIGIIDNYSFFNNYYIDIMAKLEKLYYALENNENLVAVKSEIGQANSLVVIKQNKFLKFLKNIRKLLFHSGDEYIKE